MKTFIRKAVIIFAALFLLHTVDCMASPVALPKASTGGASILQNLGTNVTNSWNSANTDQKVNVMEYHVATVTAGMTVASFLQYINCPNGGSYVPGSAQLLTSAPPNTNSFVYYFCSNQVYPWYYTSTNPVYYYDQARTITYAAIQAGLVTWNNPALPSSVGTEQVTTSSVYKNGPPTLTFSTSTCDNNYGNYGENTGSYVAGALWTTSTLTANTGGGTTWTATATLPAGSVTNASNENGNAAPQNYCSTLASVSVPGGFVGQNVAVNVSYSGGPDAIWAGYNVNGWTWMYLYGKNNWSGFTHTATTNSCAGNLTVTAAMIASPTTPIYFECTNTYQSGYSSPGASTTIPTVAWANWFSTILSQY